MRKLAVLLSLATAVSADVYMHNPRGSNDRGCEPQENRDNDYLLWDSQNNAKGGYACPRAWPFRCYTLEYNETARDQCNLRNVSTGTT